MGDVIERRDNRTVHKQVSPDRADMNSYLNALRDEDRDALTQVFLSSLDSILPSHIHIFAVGSSTRVETYTDVDIHVGIPHLEIPTIAAQVFDTITAHPRVTIQKSTREKDQNFSSLLPIGLGFTVDNKTVLRVKSRGLFDIAIMRYDRWKSLLTDGTAVLLR